MLTSAISDSEAQDPAVRVVGVSEDGYGHGPIRLLKMLNEADTELLEFLGGFIGIAWAAMLFMPGITTFQQEHFRLINYLFSQREFGVIMLIHGIAKLSGLQTGNQALRRGAALFGVCLWAMLATNFALTAPRSLATAQMAAMAIAAGICYRRRVQEARIARIVRNLQETSMANGAPTQCGSG